MFNARFARQQPLPCQPHHGRHVRDMMWCDKPSFVQIGPLVGNYDISNIFQHGGRPPSWILKILIFRLLILIDVQICCCLPNFIKIGSPVRSPDAYNCWMFDVPLLGNSRYHGNRIMTYIIIGDVMRCDHPIFVQIGPSIGKLWHLHPPSWILKILIFIHVTVIEVLICCCLPNFIKISSRVQPPDARICWMFNQIKIKLCIYTAPIKVRLLTGASYKYARSNKTDRRPLPWQRHIEHQNQRPLPCQPHHGGHVGDTMGWDGSSFVEIGHSRPPTMSIVWSIYLVKIWCRSDFRRWRYCDFMVLPVWLENV